jgi:hypothetical protein
MLSMIKPVMKVVNSETGRMVCRVCGEEHYALIKPDSNGQFYRSAWKCRNGCKI